MRFIAFVACLTLMACPSSAPVGGSDSGSGVVDSGATATDSGSEAVDAGVLLADSGQPVVTRDSGPVASDDAGVVVVEDDAGADQGTSCVEAIECALACDPTSRSCPFECIAAVDPSQEDVTQAVAACAQQNRCRDLECIMRNCQRQANACLDASGGGPGPGPGDMDGGMVLPPERDMTCAEFLVCADECLARDRRCLAACNDGVRRESIRLSDALTSCMFENRCGDLDCARRSCPDEAAACARDVR